MLIDEWPRSACSRFGVNPSSIHRLAAKWRSARELKVSTGYLRIYDRHRVQTTPRPSRDDEAGRGRPPWAIAAGVVSPDARRPPGQSADGATARSARTGSMERVIPKTRVGSVNDICPVLADLHARHPEMDADLF